MCWDMNLNKFMSDYELVILRREILRIERELESLDFDDDANSEIIAEYIRALREISVTENRRLKNAVYLKLIK